MLKPIKSGINKLLATVALLSLELIIILVSFFGAMGLFIFIVRMVFWKKKQGLDDYAHRFLSEHANNPTTEVMRIFSFFGSHYFLIAANLLLVLYFLFIKKHRWYSIKIPAVAISSVVFLFILKGFFHRPRPLDPLAKASGYSFPSGHSLMSFTFYGLLIYMVHKNVTNVWLRWILTCGLVFMIFFIGISRVYLNVHHFSDVIAGFCLGLMWLVLIIWIIDKIEQYGRRKINPVVQD